MYDLAYIAANAEVIEADLLIDAVREQQLRRSLTVPRPLVAPSATWPAEYDRAMGKMTGTDDLYSAYAQAIRIVEERVGATLDRVGASPRI